MTRDEWLAGFAAEVGAEAPTVEQVDRLLELAGIAAHASERTAAPIVCWLAAMAGVDPAEAVRIAKEITPADR